MTENGLVFVVMIPKLAGKPWNIFLKWMMVPGGYPWLWKLIGKTHGESKRIRQFENPMRYIIWGGRHEFQRHPEFWWRKPWRKMDKDGLSWFIQSQNEDLFNRYWHLTKHIVEGFDKQTRSDEDGFHLRDHFLRKNWVVPHFEVNPHWLLNHIWLYATVSPKTGCSTFPCLWTTNPYQTNIDPVFPSFNP